MPMNTRAREMGPKDKKMKTKMPRDVMLSPTGDLGAYRVDQIPGAFPRPIKRAGGVTVSSDRLPYRKPDVAIDPKFGPGDRVA